MSKSAFQPVRKENLSEEVAAQIRKEILRGAYAAGDKLPSERELALAFGITRTTVREALQKLQQLGLVRIRQGAGVEVLDYRESGNVDLLLHLLITPDESGRYDARAFMSAMEALQVLYKTAVKIAFSRMSSQEVSAVEALLEKQIALTDIDEFIENDGQIHRAVFRGTKNIALQLLFNTFLEIYEAYSTPFRIFFEKDIKEGGHSVIRAYYARALELLRSRDIDGICALIDEIFRPRDIALFERMMKTYTF